MDPTTITHHAAPSGWLLAVIVILVIFMVAAELLIYACVIWLTSKLITPQTGTFKNACKYIGAIILYELVGGFFFGFVSAMFESPGQYVFFELLLFVLLLIVASYVIMMKIYEIGFLHAFGFKVVISLIMMGLFYAIFAMTPQRQVASQRAIYEKMFNNFKASLEHKHPTPSEQPSATTPQQSQSPVSTPRPAVMPARPLSLPAEVAMIQPVQISVVIGGKDAGMVTLQRGMRVKLISVEGDQLKIQYIDTVTTIPRVSTDLPASAK